MPRFSHVVAAVCVAGLTLAAPVSAQNVDNVLVVINESNADSIKVGEYYVQKRAVAKDHTVRIKTANAETIQRADYERTIEGPIGATLLQRKLQDRVLYIVLTKGVPLRVAGTEGPEGVVASVDSELALLYRKLVGQTSPLVGRIANPYYLGDGLLASARPFTRISSDIYLVTRLDGYTAQDATSLVDRALSPARDGKIVLDQKATFTDAGGDKWLTEAADRLRGMKQADRVVLEETKALATATGPVLGYFSWGSNDSANKLRSFGMKFANGALAGMFVSTDGRTFAEPAANWKPGDTANARGSGTQSLVGDLIRDGVTGVAGHVAEPYLDATIRPQILFPVYLQGFNLAESFYMAMPYLSWQTIVIGDPLCSPFARAPLSTEQIDKGIDPETEWPAVYAERRLAAQARTGLKPEALKLLLKVEARTASGNREGLEGFLVKATDIEPRLTPAHLQLAALYERTAQYDKAIDRYRKALAQEPRNPLVLNNLAYALAVQGKAPAEALPLAQLAYDLSKTVAIADTLGWIKHLLGDSRGAAPLIERALAAAPLNTELLIHAAAVHAALNDVAKARGELDAAAKFDPKIETRDDVKALRQKIGARQ